jgi:hypothetical protein
VAGELMASLLENLLEAVTRILKATLQRTGANTKLPGHVNHLGAPARKPSLDSPADTLRKSLLASMLFQLLIELGREHSK